MNWTDVVSAIGKALWDKTSGYKTYVAAAGLLGLALYQFSQQQYDQAAYSLFTALAATGLRDRLGKLFGKAEAPAGPEAAPEID